MVDDRNLTSHTYNEGIAVKIYLRLQFHYYQLIEYWFEIIKKK
ncbi:hypothetical protein KHA80_13020 [Anaerobacillus sp. HL2]|nr:hypothetical protein KHA80_13020 [Anaerobacillus sp. HL2]